MAFFAIVRKILELPLDRAASFRVRLASKQHHERVKPKVPMKENYVEACSAASHSALYARGPDVLTPTCELNLSVSSHCNSIIYKAKRLRRGLLMLSVITPLKLDIFTHHVKEVCTKCEPTHRTVDLMFAKVCKLAGCTWNVDELLELVNIESQADLLHRLPDTKVNTKRWHLKHVQKQVMNGLCCLAVFRSLCGVTAHFCITRFKGDTRLLSLVHGAVVGRWNRLVLPHFVLPTCFRNRKVFSVKEVKAAHFPPWFTHDYSISGRKRSNLVNTSRDLDALISKFDSCTKI